MEDKQKTRNQILHRLKMQGSQTASNLAEQLRVSPMAIRQHLQALQAEGWVQYRQEQRGLGRPVKLWQLSDRAAKRFPDSHADLMVDLLQSVQKIFGEAGLEQLLAERTQRQIQIYTGKLAAPDTDPDWRYRVAAIAQFRTQEGYMAEVIELDNALLLVENHCPIHAAAQTCHHLCGSELEVFRHLLGPTATIERVEHIIQGDRRCAYRIQPTTQVHSA